MCGCSSRLLTPAIIVWAETDNQALLYSYGILWNDRTLFWACIIMLTIWITCKAAWWKDLTLPHRHCPNDDRHWWKENPLPCWYHGGKTTYVMPQYEFSDGRKEPVDMMEFVCCIPHRIRHDGIGYPMTGHYQTYWTGRQLLLVIILAVTSLTWPGIVTRCIIRFMPAQCNNVLCFPTQTRETCNWTTNLEPHDKDVYGNYYWTQW